MDEGIRAEQKELQLDLVTTLSCLDRAAHRGRCTGYLAKRDVCVAIQVGAEYVCA